MMKNYLFRPLRLLVLLLIIGASWTAASAQCTVNVKNKTIAQTLEAIENASDYSFFYAETVPDLKKKVSLTANNEGIETVLSRLFAGTRIGYKVIGHQVVLSDRNNQRSQEVARQMSQDLQQGHSSTANPITLRGHVLDANGEPIVGATVMGPGGQGTATDIDGAYSLRLSKPGKVTYKFIGYADVVRNVASSGTFDVTLEENATMLEDVVVVGYGTQKKINLTGAVSSVDVTKQLEGRPVADVARNLQGAVPGLNVRTSTGEMGTDAVMKIRGILGSVNGSSLPLILVDNVECNSLQNINPEDIESVSVLKDAASASIYGVKAAFGVVLITTKQAKTGQKTQISYSDNFSWRGPTVTPEIVSAWEGAEMSWAAGLRQNPTLSEQTNSCYLTWNLESIERMKEWDRVYGGYNLSDEMVMGRDFDVIDGKMFFYRSFDAPDRFIDKSAFQQTHNLSLQGSTGNTAYNVGLGYLGEDGIIKVNTDKYKRYNVSFSTTSTLNKYVDIRTKLLYTHYKYETPYYFGPSSYYDEWYYLYRWPKIMPYGTYQGIPWHNAITEIEQAKRNSKSNNFMRIALGTTIHILPGLNFEADYTFAHVNRYSRTNGGQAEGWNFWGGAGMRNEVWTLSSHNKVVNSNDNSDQHTFNGLFRYNTAFGEKHDFGAILGTNVEYYTNYGNTAERRDMILLDHPEISLTNTDQQFATSYHGHEARLGFFARINYTFMRRYLFELNARLDGSSNFPPDELWGFFPSFSAGWLISEENFFKPLKPAFSTFKIRGSWGMIGNQDIGSYQFLPILSTTSTTWIKDTNRAVSFGLPRAISSGFSWEKVTTTDIGADLRFFNNKFGVTFDWFKRVTSDMITDGYALPATFGQTAPKINFGTLTTKGWELALDFHHRFNFGLGMNITATLSDAKTKYTKLNTASRLVDGLYEGKEYGEIWGFETDRLYQKEDFVYDENGNIEKIWFLNGQEVAPGTDGAHPANRLSDPNGAYQYYYETDGWFYFGPGDVKYKDLNGDGRIDPGNSTVEDHGDLKRIGNSCPRYEYGIRLDLDWKGVDLGIFFQGVGKRDYWGSGSIVIPGFNYLEAWYTHQLDYWTEDNTDAFYPRLTNQGQSNNSRNFKRQTRYLLDMSYCRLKNITLGYTLPAKWTEKIMIKKLRIYGAIENLLTFDHMHDVPIDPETQYNTGDGDYLGRSYPYAKTFSFGLQVTF